MAKGRRLFDRLDIASLRAHANWREFASVVIIAIIVAAVPIIFTIMGIDEDKR